MTPPRLRDPYHREINYLRVSITDRCNLRCSYCMPAQGVEPLPHGDILSYEEIFRVARAAVGLGIRKIRVTGGEPLVRKGVEAFLGRLADLDGVTDLSLTTNGLQLAARAEALSRVGLERVNVSLDTLRPKRFERITRRPGFDRVMAGLEAAHRAGLKPIKINTVAIRGINDDEVLDFVALAETHPYEVRFIEFMPSRSDAWTEDHVLPAQEILERIRTRYDITPLDPGPSGGPSRMFALPRGGRFGVISPLSDHFCGTCNRLRLTAAGHLRTCLFSDHEIDLRTLLRNGTDDDTLAAVIRDAVANKPEGHTLGGREGSPKCGLTMNRVGG